MYACFDRSGVRMNSPEHRSLHTVSYAKSADDTAVGLTKLDKSQRNIASLCDS
jgi:hypothetical protein